MALHYICIAKQLPCFITTSNIMPYDIMCVDLKSQSSNVSVRNYKIVFLLT